MSPPLSICISICSETLLFSLIPWAGLALVIFCQQHLPAPPSLFATFVIPLFFSHLRREGLLEIVGSQCLLFCFQMVGQVIDVESQGDCFFASIGRSSHWASAYLLTSLSVLKSLSLRMLCCTLIKPDDSAASTRPDNIYKWMLYESSADSQEE